MKTSESDVRRVLASELLKGNIIDRIHRAGHPIAVDVRLMSVSVETGRRIRNILDQQNMTDVTVTLADDSVIAADLSIQDMLAALPDATDTSNAGTTEMSVL